MYMMSRNVVIAMEALDQLLMACHSQSIKPFVESFLHMVAKLLESREPDLQVLGTNSVREDREPGDKSSLLSGRGHRCGADSAVTFYKHHRSTV